MHSHYGINATSKLRLKNITKLLVDAHNKDLEDRLWQRWLAERPLMEEFVSFEDYKIKAFGNKTVLNKEEILKDAEEARRLVEEGR